MATNAPCTLCWVCGRPNEYRVVEHYRPPGTPIRYGPTDWQMVPHDHTQAEVDAWLEKVKVNAPMRPFFTKIENKDG